MAPSRPITLRQKAPPSEKLSTGFQQDTKPWGRDVGGPPPLSPGCTVCPRLLLHCRAGLVHVKVTSSRFLLKMKILTGEDQLGRTKQATDFFLQPSGGVCTSKREPPPPQPAHLCPETPLQACPAVIPTTGIISLPPEARIRLHVCESSCFDSQAELFEGLGQRSDPTCVISSPKLVPQSPDSSPQVSPQSYSQNQSDLHKCKIEHNTPLLKPCR
ncbi:uncharacterized protein LOC131516080 [Neofelis nebulosa]|uniref:uncharacterized protein LOC131516080 n=1 Tax=Neofelis nebulosa TaxID=61452 RepID=UPI00272BD50A|nr:uncharacterized protein LOC131516080 [Neofelis nebulosa]